MYFIFADKMIMSMMKDKKRKLIKRVLLLLFFILICVAVLFFPKYLFKEEVEDAGILVVEGWLPEYVLKEAIDIYNSGDYEALVTTGDELDKDFKIHSSGTLIFDLKDLNYDNEDREINKITVCAFGSKADKEYAHFQLIINDSLAGDTYVKRKKREYVFHIIKKLKDIKTISIRFDNDGCTYWRDRNLYVEYIALEDIRINARSEQAYYSINRLDNYEEFSPRFTNNAEYSAFIMKYLGFRDSIIALPVLSVEISRTYSCAEAFREWYTSSEYKDLPVNIISLGPHTRRTWIIYRRVLGRGTDTGIILVNNPRYDQRSWWRTSAGIKATLHEMLSYIYSVIILPFII